MIHIRPYESFILESAQSKSPVEIQEIYRILEDNSIEFHDHTSNTQRKNNTIHLTILSKSAIQLLSAPELNSILDENAPVKKRVDLIKKIESEIGPPAGSGDPSDLFVYGKRSAARGGSNGSPDSSDLVKYAGHPPKDAAILVLFRFGKRLLSKYIHKTGRQIIAANLSKGLFDEIVKSRDPELCADVASNPNITEAHMFELLKHTNIYVVRNVLLNPQVTPAVIKLALKKKSKHAVDIKRALAKNERTPAEILIDLLHNEFDKTTRAYVLANGSLPADSLNDYVSNKYLDDSNASAALTHPKLSKNNAEDLLDQLVNSKFEYYQHEAVSDPRMKIDTLDRVIASSQYPQVVAKAEENLKKRDFTDWVFKDTWE